MAATDAFGWINYSSGSFRVSFDAEVGRKLTCASPGGFRIVGDRLESGEIRSGYFVSLCRLAPGEYDYELEMFSAEGEEASRSHRILRGKLLVGWALELGPSISR